MPESNARNLELQLTLLMPSDNLKAMSDEVLCDDRKLAKLVKIIGTVLHTKLAN